MQGIEEFLESLAEEIDNSLVSVAGNVWTYNCDIARLVRCGKRAKESDQCEQG